MVLSSEPEAKVQESGDQEMQFTPARWPVRVVWWAPVVADQIFMVASAEQLAIQAPSGENFTAVTPRLWPRRMRRGLKFRRGVVGFVEVVVVPSASGGVIGARTGDDVIPPPGEPGAVEG